MTIFALLVALILAKLFKTEQTNSRIYQAITTQFDKRTPPSAKNTAWLVGMSFIVMMITYLIFSHLFFGFFWLITMIYIAYHGIGIGAMDKYYHDYVLNVRKHPNEATTQFNHCIHYFTGINDRSSADEEGLTSLQYNLIWLNYRYYLAPIIYFTLFGDLGAIVLALYILLRQYQIWLTQHTTPDVQKASMVDQGLFWLDWLPVRLTVTLYAFLAKNTLHLSDVKTAWLSCSASPYQLLNQAVDRIVSKDNNDSFYRINTISTLTDKATTWLIIIIVMLTLLFTLFA